MTTIQDCNKLTIMHILHTYLILIILLKLLFNTMLSSGVCLNAFGYNVTIPVIKDVKNSVND